MKTQSLAGTALIALFCFAELRASEITSAGKAKQPVGLIFGKLVTAAEIKLTGPIDPTVEFNASDTARWEMSGRILKAFGKPVFDRFVRGCKIEVTAKEIESFQATTKKGKERRLEELGDELTILSAELESATPTADERSKLVKKKEDLERSIAIHREMYKDATPAGIARHMIKQWKIERELHRVYGGRVIFQQFGLEALDARRMLYEEAESNGELIFYDPGVRHMFYYYYSHMRHTVIDSDLLEKPWFLLDGS